MNSYAQQIYYNHPMTVLSMIIVISSDFYRIGQDRVMDFIQFSSLHFPVPYCIVRTVKEIFTKGLTEEEAEEADRGPISGKHRHRESSLFEHEAGNKAS